MKDPYKLRSFVYLCSIFILTFLLISLMYKLIDFDLSNTLYVILWLPGFSILIFNVSYMAVSSIGGRLIKLPKLPEIELDELPRTAILFLVKDESYSELKNNIIETYSNNNEKNFDLIILSDTTNVNLLERERNLLTALKRRFGNDRNFYVTRIIHRGFKFGAIIDWVEKYGSNYEYFVVCDSDSILPKDSVKKLLAIAEHPVNKNIVIFQTFIRAEKGRTHFARIMGTAQTLCQRTYTRLHQYVFGSSMYFGKNALIRMIDYRRLTQKVDKSSTIYSHDLWETALLDEDGKKTVFIENVESTEQFPPDYISMIKRDLRWAKGNFQSLRLAFKQKISRCTRFNILYSAYMYLIPLIFLLWIIASFFANTQFSGEMLYFQSLMTFGCGIHAEVSYVFIISLGVVFLNLLPQCKNRSEVGKLAKEIMISTFLCLNSVIHNTINLFALGCAKKWIPTKKDVQINKKTVLRYMMPTTIIGIVAFILGFLYARIWMFVTLPFLSSFVLGIPLTIITSRKIRD